MSVNRRRCVVLYDPHLIQQIEAEQKRRGHGSAARTMRALVEERLSEIRVEARFAKKKQPAGA